MAVRHCSNVQKGGCHFALQKERAEKTCLDHSACQKRSPLSNHDTLPVWTSKQGGSLSFFFHVLTTHPHKGTLLSGKLLAFQFLKGLCAPLRLVISFVKTYRCLSLIPIDPQGMQQINQLQTLITAK